MHSIYVRGNAKSTYCTIFNPNNFTRTIGFIVFYGCQFCVRGCSYCFKTDLTSDFSYSFEFVASFVFCSSVKSVCESYSLITGVVFTEFCDHGGNCLPGQMYVNVKLCTLF